MNKKRAFLAFIAGIAFAGNIFSYSQSQMFQKPGVMGDSLSHGFYGATVESKTQNWAYPVLVARQAGSNVSYNTLKGPFINLEDVLNLDCGPICIASTIIGGNAATVSLPTHAGITGAEYTSALYTSGQCQDINAKKWEKEWYWKKIGWFWYPTYRWVQVADCQKPDKFHQYGLRSSGTQVQIMEKVQPSFVLGTVAANHVLCTALHTSLDCLDEARYKRDVRETMRRIRNIGNVKGGVLFSIPNVTAISYLEEYSDPQGRYAYSGLKAFYRNGVSNPSEVLDAGEVNTITNFLAMLNNELKAQAAAMNWAFADIKVAFDDVKENGRPIVASNGYSPGNAHANWPLPGKPGVFGLDGVHPNRYGHSIMANEMIGAINAQYGFSIPKVNEYSAWYYDSLNRNPIDLKGFLSNNIIGQFISWLINIFV